MTRGKKTPSIKRIYYAHPKGMYGSVIEAKDMLYLDKWYKGLEIVNPSCPYWEKGWMKWGMEFFDKKVLPQVTDFAFRPYPGGEIGCGVWHELLAFWKKYPDKRVAMLVTDKKIGRVYPEYFVRKDMKRLKQFVVDLETTSKLNQQVRTFIPE